MAQNDKKLSVALHILGSQGGGKSEKNDPKWQKILSVSLRISVTLPHMGVV